MKLETILSKLNSLEKNSFLKIIDNIINETPKKHQEVEKILDESSKELKNVDNINISKIFTLIEDEFTEYVRSEFVDPHSQLDIISDILIRDGRCVARKEWFNHLYEKEINNFDKKLKRFSKDVKSENSELEERRKRDYRIYHACIITAFCNDDERNQERKITTDEQSILLTLSSQLGLSMEEQKLINYSVIPIVKKDIDTLISDLKSIGILFYSRKHNTVFIPQEIVRVLRRIRGKAVANKYYRRVLKNIREPIINIVCRKHNIDWKLQLDEKIELIISGGISFKDLLIEDIHKENTTLNERKKYFNELVESKLNIQDPIRGTVIEEKVDNLVKYFNDIELDEKVLISMDGYEKLLRELGESIPGSNNYLKSFFELQEEKVLSAELMIDYNLKPQDILEILPESLIKEFIEKREIKLRGDLIQNILESYKDAENLYLENYVNIAFRDYKKLKDNNITISEAYLGVKFEDLTKKIFKRLGFNVDESLRKKLNTSKDKIDIILNLGKKNIILVECKSVKEKGYNKFSSVYRQLKAYRDLANKEEFNVVKSLLIAPEFSDEFVNDCELEYELNLSLLTAESFINILHGFKESKMEKLPYKLLMRDVLLQPERILKAIK
ncbi:MAG: hypothetical protein U5K32_09780 [Bacteroidales bacterium]|nr:hypothetical protein [Bacteroidales bacterium]